MVDNHKSQPVPASVLMREATGGDLEHIVSSNTFTPGLTPAVLLLSLEAARPHVWAIVNEATNLPYLVLAVNRVNDSLFGAVSVLCSPGLLPAQAALLKAQACHILDRVFTEGNFKAIGNVVQADNIEMIQWLESLNAEFRHLNRSIPELDAALGSRCTCGQDSSSISSGNNSSGGRLYHSFALTKEGVEAAISAALNGVAAYV